MTLATTIKNTALALAAVTVLGTGFATTDASAAGYYVNAPATVKNFPNWDVLNIRKWPASHSGKVAHVYKFQSVHVERCIIKAGADWCKIQSGWKRGWVNGRYLVRWGQTFATPHPAGYGWH